MAQTVENAVRMIVARPKSNAKRNSLETTGRSILSKDQVEVEKTRRYMHQLKQTVHEAKEPDSDELSSVATRVSGSTDALAQQIAAALNRYSFLDKAEDRGMLLLISALALLNLSDNSDNINGTVRRLMAAGISQMKRK